MTDVGTVMPMLASATVRGSWQRFQALPLVVQVAVWLLVVILWPGTTFLLLFGVAAMGVWLWERYRSVAFDLWGWSRHLFAMVFAMLAGMWVYMAGVKPLLTALGQGWLVSGDLSYTWMIIAMVIPMVALMRVEGHSWRMTHEMSLGMVVPMVVCVALVRLGVAPLVPFLSWLTASNVYTAAWYGMYIGMIVAVVYQRGMYVASQRSHGQLQAPCGGSAEGATTVHAHRAK